MINITGLDGMRHVVYIGSNHLFSVKHWPCNWSRLAIFFRIKCSQEISGACRKKALSRLIIEQFFAIDQTQPCLPLQSWEYAMTMRHIFAQDFFLQNPGHLQFEHQCSVSIAPGCWMVSYSTGTETDRLATVFNIPAIRKNSVAWTCAWASCQFPVIVFAISCCKEIVVSRPRPLSLLGPSSTFSHVPVYSRWPLPNCWRLRTSWQLPI